MNAAVVAEDVIIQQVSIEAPAERIFEALTNPDELALWWRVEGKFQAVEVKVDLRPGGKWRMRVEGGCGGSSSTIVEGEFRRIEPPRLLVYTWARIEEEEPESEVRWDLEEVNGVTTVRVTHSGLVTEHLRQRNNGWPMIMDLLKAYAERHNNNQ